MIRNYCDTGVHHLSGYLGFSFAQGDYSSKYQREFIYSSRLLPSSKSVLSNETGKNNVCVSVQLFKEEPILYCSRWKYFVISPNLCNQSPNSSNFSLFKFLVPLLGGRDHSSRDHSNAYMKCKCVHDNGRMGRREKLKYPG